MKASLFPFFLLLFLAACNTEKNSVPCYCTCCETRPQADEIPMPACDTLGNPIGPARVYFPNVFINDDPDQINDHWLPFTNECALVVSTFIIKDEDGNILVQKSQIQPNLWNDGWDGRNPDGSLFKGAFQYEVSIKFIDGTEKTYTGKAAVTIVEQMAFQ
ncbi:MAG: hypothetical protein IPL65_10375 [Lewinellaceae bacterium]|nr:hypothetical protein [Lewinellaceae bacterium]